MDLGGRARWTRTILVILFVVAALHAIWMIVVRSGDPRNYLSHWLNPGERFSYPIGSVVMSCLMLVLETAGILAILVRGPARTLWQRSLSCLALAVPIGVAGALMMVDSAPAFGFHVFWIWTTIGLLAGVSTVAGSAQLIARWLEARRSA